MKQERVGDPQGHRNELMHSEMEMPLQDMADDLKVLVAEDSQRIALRRTRCPASRERSR